MNTLAIHSAVSRWAALGVLFYGELSPVPAEVELLLLDTARQAPENVRLLIMGTTWLAHYGAAISDQRLAQLIRSELAPDDQPVMGLMLDLARINAVDGAPRFEASIMACQLALGDQAMPLSMVDRSSPFLRELVRERASEESIRWGRWIEPFELKTRALRPADWVRRQNPTLTGI